MTVNHQGRFHALREQTAPCEKVRFTVFENQKFASFSGS